MSSHRTVKRSAVAQGALLIALLVAAQLSTLAHFALVPHSICASDGEIAHGHHDHEQHAAAHESDDHVDLASPILTPTDEEGAHDEHCALEELGRPKKLALIQEPQGFLPAQALREVATLHAAPLGSGIAVYLFAPKQSPPRVGATRTT